MIDQKYIDDNRIVARYLADQLSDHEREGFEAYYREHPEVVLELEATAKFKAGLKQLRESGELDELIKPPTWRPRIIALAASVMFAVIGIGWWSVAQRPAAPILAAAMATLLDQSGSPLPATASYDLLHTRNSFDAKIALPKQPEAIALRLMPEVSSPRYRMSLAAIADDGSRRKLATLAALQADADGVVTVYLSSARLAPGVYEVGISADTDTLPADDLFMIQVLPTEDTQRPAN